MGLKSANQYQGKSINCFCRDCGDRLTEDNHRSDHTGHIYPDCKPCCYGSRALKKLKKQYSYGVAACA